MRVADYVIDQIYKAGCEHIFLVTGGGAMHLNDAVAAHGKICLLYTSPSPRDQRGSRMPSSA